MKLLRIVIVITHCSYEIYLSRIDNLNRDISRLQSDTNNARRSENEMKNECAKLGSEVKQLTRKLTLVTKVSLQIN